MTHTFRRVNASVDIKATRAMAGEEARPCDFWPFLAGALEADYADLARRHNELLDALAKLAPESDTPFEVELTNRTVTSIRLYPQLARSRPIRFGTEHVTAKPPYAIPEAARKALKCDDMPIFAAHASVDAMLTEDDDEGVIAGSVDRHRKYVEMRVEMERREGGIVG